MFYFALYRWPAVFLSESVHHSTALPYDAILLYGTVIHRDSNSGVIPCIKTFAISTHDDAPQVMQLPWHATLWLEKTCCLRGIKNNPCERGHTHFVAHELTQQNNIHYNPEQKAKKVFGVSPRNQYFINKNWTFPMKSSDFMEDTIFWIKEVVRLS